MPDALDILKKHWGYDSFRPMQREIIESVLAGHDTLGLLPTGAGKSVTFQVPGLVLGGVTIVITPLIALMKDQVDHLRSHGIKAAFLHSGMTYGQTNRVWQALVNGGCRFLYVAPERLRSRRFIDELKGLKNVCLIVADEAHCISQWGHDFRPAYLGLSELRRHFPGVPVMAVTASATPDVVKDIRRQLAFKDDSLTFRTSFARPNISYVVRHTPNKIHQILHILSRVPGTSIVYVRSRRLTLEIAAALRDGGVEALPFHAGLEFAVKEQRINNWKNGSCRVMVSTNAFGMGIDKPDVRTVIHYDLPPSLEEYYQEAGRAGRDGLQSYAVLLTDDGSVSRMKRRLSLAFPPRDVIAKIYERVCNYLNIAVEEGYGRTYEFDIEDFCATFGMQRTQVEGALQLLGSSGYLNYEQDSFTSARILIEATREELYSVTDVTGHTDDVLRSLLRRCPGIFADYVFFSESQVAADAGCSVETVYQTIIALRRAGVLKYVPMRRAPVIHVLTSREEPRYVQIPVAVYETRRATLQQRMEAVIGFATATAGCRASRILEYFGETHPEPCHTCDLCRAQARPLDRKRIDGIRQRVCDLICASPEGVTETLIHNRFVPHADIALDVLRQLADSGLVSKQGTVYKAKYN